jgi:hypothetical protein
VRVTISEPLRGMDCAALIERAGVEHNSNADSMLVAEVTFMTAKRTCASWGLSAGLWLTANIPSRAVLRLEMPEQRWKPAPFEDVKEIVSV